MDAGLGGGRLRLRALDSLLLDVQSSMFKNHIIQPTHPSIHVCSESPKWPNSTVTFSQCHRRSLMLDLRDVPCFLVQQLVETEHQERLLDGKHDC